MGYKRPKLLLTFADGDMAGLEVHARRLTLGALADLAELATLDAEHLNSPDSRQQLGALYKTLADQIVSWNYVDDDDRPVPTTAESLAAQDGAFVLALSNALIDAASGSVPAPLKQPSGDGSPSVEESIPMEVL